MRFVSGVGEHKLALYGQRFLDLILQQGPPEILNNRLSSTINETLYLHHQGLNIEQIARQRDLKPATVYDHFAEAIAAGVVNVRQILPLNENDYKRISAAMELLRSCDEKGLKSLYETLDKAYDYPVLRCIIASESG